MPDLCPGCVRDYQDPETGLCRTCSERNFVDGWLEKDKVAVDARRENWRGWSSSTDAVRERQHKHRLLTDTKPAKRAHEFSDPLEIAHEALQKMTLIKRGIPATSGLRTDADEVMEAIKQLSWGPESVPSPPKKIPPGLLGMHRRWHVKGGKPCNCPPGVTGRAVKEAGR